MTESLSSPDPGLPKPETPANRLAEAVKPLWSAKHAVKVLKLDDFAALERAVCDGNLLGLRTSDDVLVLPVWQFQRVGTVVAVRPGLRPVLTALCEVDSWTVAQWLLAPSPELGGRSALAVATEEPESELLQSLVDWVRRDWTGDQRG